MCACVICDIPLDWASEEKEEGIEEASPGQTDRQTAIRSIEAYRVEPMVDSVSDSFMLVYSKYIDRHQYNEPELLFTLFIFIEILSNMLQA